MMQRTEKIIYKILIVLLLMLFLPVLFSILFIDRLLPYYEECRLATLLPNFVLFPVGLPVLAVIGIWISRKRANCAEHTACKKYRALLKKLSLPAVFLLLYIVNVYIARETVYYTSWDPEIVRGYAYMLSGGIPLGYDLYLVLYPNNITISYVLGVLYNLAEHWKSYPYNSEFLWIQVGCALICIAGLAACLTVKRVTENRRTVWACAAAYIICVGFTPWKTVPYTDVYSMAFPVMSICFYVHYRYRERKASGWFCLGMAYVCAALGGLVKPSVYVILIAILLTEVWATLFSGERGRWKLLLLDAVLAVAVLAGSNMLKGKMIDEMGLIQNENIEATWHHYFYMGLNEKTTGGYNSDDCTMFGEFQDRPLAERNKAELERGLDRIRERGVGGSLYFWLRKMVMTFNDGTLGWQAEGDNESPFAPIANGGAVTNFLRDVFWRNSRYAGRYNTICQFFWIMVLVCLPGICFDRKRTMGQNSLFLVSFLGIFFYLLLFEARARYLLCFAPLLVVQATLGLENYSFILSEFIKHRRNKDNGRSKEDAPAGVH